MALDLGTLRPIFAVLLQTKYAGIVAITLLDNTILPFPGEILLLFAGYLIYIKQMDLLLTIIACASGATLGALLGYVLGRRYGERTIERFGRFVLLDRKHLRQAQKWFDRKGAITVFYSRFIPGIGHLISIPAGASRMSLPRFLLFSFAASFVWYGVVVYLAYLFGTRWDLFFEYYKPLQTAFIVLGATVIILFVVQRIRENGYFKGWLRKVWRKVRAKR